MRSQAEGWGGSGLVLLAAVLWGTTGTAQQFAPPGASPLTVGSLRLLLGGGALWTIVHLRHQLARRRGVPVPVIDRPWHPALLAAAIGTAGYQAAFFAGVARIGVAAGTLITIGSAPMWAGMLELFVLKAKPTGRWAAATATAVVGVALLVGTGTGEAVDLGGMLLPLAAGASFALYTVSMKAIGGRFLGQEERIAAWALLLGGVMLLPVLFMDDIGWLRHPRGAAVAMHLGLMATALPYALFGRGLANVSAAAAATLTLAEPLTAALLGVTLLGERLGFSAVVGAGVVMVGLLILAAENRTKRADDGNETHPSHVKG